MTDRELLELAAKAASVEGRYMEWHHPVAGSGVVASMGYKPWNPLADDGDALRLAVKLGIDVAFEGDNVVFADGNHSEFLPPDRNAATRRAIVRAAAELGARK